MAATAEHIDNKNKGIVEDKCIYVRVENGRENGEMYWYVIRGDCKTPQKEYLKPIFQEKKKDQSYSAVAAVGSVIYVFGGGDYRQFDYKTYEAYDGRVNSVYYIDTNRPETGWLEAPPMIHPRTRFAAFPMNERGEILVFRGRFELHDVEVYNLEKQTWSHWITDPRVFEMPPLTSHAVVDGGRKLLVMSHSDERIFSYDVDKNSFRIERQNIFKDGYVNAWAVSDEVLYLVGNNLPSCIMALELNNLAAAVPKEISGLEKRESAHNIVEIAKNRLAYVWGQHCTLGIEYEVHCVKLSISKDVDEAGETTFTAHSITKSFYYVKGYLFDPQVLAVATSYWNDVNPEEMKLKDAKELPEEDGKEPEEKKLNDDGKEPEEKKLNDDGKEPEEKKLNDDGKEPEGMKLNDGGKEPQEMNRGGIIWEGSPVPVAF